jgi:hypothetical protein
MTRLKNNNGDRSTLLFTDSLCLHIQTDDLYSDMLEDLDKYGTSNYDKVNLLFSAKNAKVVGKMKDECGGKPIAEFVGLRVKMYSLLISNEPDKLRGKGVKKSYIKQNLLHSTFLEALTTGKSDPAEFYRFRSYLHTVHTVRICTVRIRKKCLSASMISAIFYPTVLERLHTAIGKFLVNHKHKLSFITVLFLS